MIEIITLFYFRGNHVRCVVITAEEISGDYLTKTSLTQNMDCKIIVGECSKLQFKSVARRNMKIEVAKTKCETCT